LHKSDVSTEPFQVYLSNFNSVDQHVSGAGIVKSFNQRNAGRFSAARLANERQSLARFDACFEAFEHEQIAASRIRKLDIGEFDVADDFRLFAFFRFGIDVRFGVKKLEDSTRGENSLAVIGSETS
jgi:hypothetical protein